MPKKQRSKGYKARSYQKRNQIRQKRSDDSQTNAGAKSSTEDLCTWPDNPENDIKQSSRASFDDAPRQELKLPLFVDEESLLPPIPDLVLSDTEDVTSEQSKSVGIFEMLMNQSLSGLTVPY